MAPCRNLKTERGRPRNIYWPGCFLYDGGIVFEGPRPGMRRRGRRRQTQHSVLQYLKLNVLSAGGSWFGLGPSPRRLLYVGGGEGVSLGSRPETARLFDLRLGARHPDLSIQQITMASLPF